MSLLVSLLIVNALHGPLPRPAQPADSIGQEMRGGQRLVRHRVTQGETIYGLSRRYHVSAEQLLAFNPELKNGLGLGEIVLVPRPGKGSAASAAAKAPVSAPAVPAGTPATHTVGKGETLYGIAQRYHTTPAALAELNGLPAGSGVRLGQELRLRPDAAGGLATTPAPAVAATPAPAKPTPARAPLPVPTPAPVKVDTNREAVVATVTPAPAEPVEKEKVVIKDKDGNKEKEKIKEEAPKVPTRAADLVGRKVEDGIGAGIDNSGTDKYLALHKTAPIGTIMEVRNMMNGQTVYVRVIGQLPDTGENDNILVRLSPRAVAKLGTSDAKFRVETSYVP